MADSSSIGPRAEPTPPSSHHPDNSSPTSPPGYRAPDTPPNMEAGNYNEAISCMYIPNCDTGSQLRKAISHIFGRNKMCTRLIPQHIWVHYCRKHYQRSRYRNPKEYAKLQCDLVQKQIRAIREWSESNKKKNTAGTVIDWGLAVRKREQKRLDELNSGGRKRTAAAAFDQEDADDGRGNSVPVTAVPSWLLERCGKGYSTDEILNIFSTLHTEILADKMSCFPDIEILPNIVVDEDEDKTPKGYTKRTPAAGHKRSQSLGVSSMTSNYYPNDRRMSQPGAWVQDPSPYGGSSQKRQRPNEMGMEPHERHLPSFQRPRMSERPVETGRRTQPLAHRPAYPSINEHDDGYGAQQVYQHQQQLPAPIPQRLGGQSMAAHLESTNEYAYSGRRSTHQRSQSDVSFARHATYSPTPSMAPAMHEQNGRLRHYSPAYHPEQTNSTMHYSEHHTNHVARPAYGHSRHQSTPMVQQAYHSQHSQPSTSSYGYQASNPLPPPGPQITESPQAAAIFRARR
ncbi:hypothetical protein V8E51_008183 [Hyaloscypha variabilis]